MTELDNFLVQNVFFVSESFRYQLGRTLHTISFMNGMTLPLACLVLLINLTCRRWLTASQLCLLWGLVLVRLVVPWVPVSPVSLPGAVYAPLLPKPALMVDLYQVNPSLDAEIMAKSVPVLPRPVIEKPGVTSMGIIATFCLLTWGLGLVLIPARAVFGHTRFLLGLHRNALVPDVEIVQLWTSCLQRAGIRRAIPVLITSQIQQPAVMGVFRSTLLLPTDLTSMSAQQLEMVMFHEIAHLRRFDLAANGILLGIRTIHWWNPLYWLAASRYLALREQACDEYVFKSLSPDRRRDFAELLVQLAERPCVGAGWSAVLPVSLLGMIPNAFRKTSLKSRVQSALEWKSRQSIWGRGIGVVITLCLIVSGFTIGRSQASSDPGFRIVFMSSTETERFYNDPRHPPDSSKFITKVYDVRDFADRLAEEEESTPTAALNALKDQIQSNFLVRKKAIGMGPAIIVDPAQDYGSIAIFQENGANQFIIRTSRPQHERIAEFLTACRETGFQRIEIEFHRAPSKLDLAKVSNLNWDRVESSAPSPFRQDFYDGENSPIEGHGAAIPMAVAEVPSQAVIRIRNLLKNEKSVYSTFPSKFTILHGQEVHFDGGFYQPIVTALRSNKDGQVEEVTTDLFCGSHLKLRPRISPNNSIRLVGSLDISSFDEVTQVELRIAGESRLIRTPEVFGGHLKIDAEIEEGNSLVIGVIKKDQYSDFTYYMITPRNLGKVSLRAN